MMYYLYEKNIIKYYMINLNRDVINNEKSIIYKRWILSIKVNISELLKYFKSLEVTVFNDFN